MGGKGSKTKGQGKPPTLKSSDVKFLTKQTGLDEGTIKNTFNKFMANNPDGQLDRKEFVRLYDELRPESMDRLDEISQYVFKAFDKDNNGTISFQEFMIAYALTSRGDLNHKLDYAFTVYDSDGNGYLDRNELRMVITGMLDLLGADRQHNNPQQLAEEVIREIDNSHDGRISKDEFVNGLLKNYSLRALLSPFQ